MIKHAWSILCEKAIIDKDTNNISLDVIEQMQIGLMPVPDEAEGFIMPVRLEVVSLWYRDNPRESERTQARMRIFSPADQELGISEFIVDLSTFQRLRTRTRIGGIPIPRGQTGRYVFIVEYQEGDNWLEVARLPLEISIIQEGERPN